MKKTLWPYGVAAAYIAFALAMAGLVVFAVRRPSDLVSKDYYRQEIEHQQRIEAERRAIADPDAPTVAVDARSCTVSFPGAAPTSGSLTFYRPSDAKLDRTIPLALDANGQQAVDLAGFQPGLWRLRLEWKRNSETYYLEEVAVLN